MCKASPTTILASKALASLSAPARASLSAEAAFAAPFCVSFPTKPKAAIAARAT
eukprot:CAMPEP_0167804844 /NCGR_PEP_ID=MMETSP0111_2-20121227/20769_1 /TAXON_ID=91324 /ORGANISM="Lotharella globosa, Strain CCCM811" /LENGTH=53 /DNA_ID=CAMNT_0007701773 /DNA_START=215 /DNA_END=376 /DNA_ORIENTATION=+